VLLVGYVIQAATFGATAIALYADAPVVVTVAAATLAAVAVTMTRPAQNVLLPAITHAPADLTAANTVSGLAEGFGLFLGPLAAGLLLGRSEPGDVFAVFAVLSVGNALLVLRTGIEDGIIHEAHGTGIRNVLAGTFGGFRQVRADRRVLAIVALLVGAMVMFGALDVLFVAVAIELFAESESWAGYLYASFGFGAIAGAAAAVALIGRRRLTPAFAGSTALKGLAVASIAAVPSIGLAAAVLALAGLGSTLNNIAGRTLLQRVAPEAVLARVFGVLEGLSMFALALGSILTGVLIEVLDVPSAVLIIGLTLPALVAITWRALGSIDRNARQPDPEALALLRHLPIFAPLSAPSMERILSELTWLELPAGTEFIREGEPGDRFYVVAEGRVRVTQGGRLLAEGGPGYHVGEIALLRSIPRTATVTAVTAVRAIAVERDRFLAAVTGHTASRQRAETVAADRLSNRGATPG
jgi:MFS family permease